MSPSSVNIYSKLNHTNLAGSWAPEQAEAGRSKGIQDSSHGGRAGNLPTDQEGRMLHVLQGSPQVLLSMGCIEGIRGNPRHWQGQREQEYRDTGRGDFGRLQSRDSVSWMRKD